nr:RDD family protein [uncultured Rhodopila sp.]
MTSEYDLISATYRYAGFWWRFVAALVDSIIASICGMIIGGVIGFQMGAGGADVDSVQVVGGIAGLVWNWLYFAMFESSSMRGTPGKRLLGIRVVDETGGRIGFGRATGRYFAKILSASILLVGFMMAGWTRKKQALHDMVAGCLVVREQGDYKPITLPG